MKVDVIIIKYPFIICLRNSIITACIKRWRFCMFSVNCCHMLYCSIGVVDNKNPNYSFLRIELICLVSFKVFFNLFVDVCVIKKLAW